MVVWEVNFCARSSNSSTSWNISFTIRVQALAEQISSASIELLTWMNIHIFYMTIFPPCVQQARLKSTYITTLIDLSLRRFRPYVTPNPILQVKKKKSLNQPVALTVWRCVVITGVALPRLSLESPRPIQAPLHYTTHNIIIYHNVLMLDDFP